MPQQLQITLSEDATKKYLEIAAAKTEAEVNADCEPSGPLLQIDISPFWDQVFVEQGSNNFVNVGDAHVELIGEE